MDEPTLDLSPETCEAIFAAYIKCAHQSQKAQEEIARLREKDGELKAKINTLGEVFNRKERSLREAYALLRSSGWSEQELSERIIAELGEE